MPCIIKVQWIVAWSDSSRKIHDAIHSFPAGSENNDARPLTRYERKASLLRDGDIWETSPSSFTPSKLPVSKHSASVEVFGTYDLAKDNRQQHQCWKQPYGAQFSCIR